MRHLVRILLSSIALFAHQVTYAQNPASTIDSLRKLLVSAPDTSRIAILSDLCFYSRSLSSRQALDYGWQAVNLSEKYQLKKGLSQAYNDVAIVYMDLQEYDSALNLLGKSMNLREELGDSMGVAAVCIKYGIVYQNRGQFDQSIQYAFRALAVYEQLNKKPQMGFALNNVAVIYQDIGDYKNAIAFHQRALEIRRQLGATNDMAYSFVNLANNYIKLKDFKQAYLLNDSAISILRISADQSALAAALNNQGNVLIKLNQWEKSIAFLQEGLAIREKLGDRKGTASSLTNLASVHMHFKQYTLAEAEMQRALYLSLIIGAKPERAQLYSNFADLYEALGNYQEAYRYSRLYTVLQDTLLNENSNRLIHELEAKYAAQQKEQENKILALRIEEEQKNKLLFAGAGLLTFISAIFIIYRIRSRQKAREIALHLEMETKRTKAIMDTQDKERERISSELHDGVGQLLSATRIKLTQIDHPQAAELIQLMDESVTEIRHISHDLMPGILKRGGLEPAIQELVSRINFSGTITAYSDLNLAGERFNPEMELHVYRILQELAQNALKYSEASEWHVSIQKEGGVLIVGVEDNGVGFDRNRIAKNPGNGWLNIETRARALHADLQLESSPGRGTSVFIEIPIMQVA